MIRTTIILLICALIVFGGGVWFFSEHIEDAVFSQDRHSSSQTVGSEGMPAVFDGFIDRWNSETEAWLNKSREDILRKIAQAELVPGSGDEGHRIFLKHKKELLTAYLAELENRLKEGKAILALDEEDLPAGLDWQNGLDEPDIGDPAARKGGGINLWHPTGFPATLRPFGPSSKNYFNYSLYDNVDMLLVRIHPQTGGIIPGLASEWAVSGDGRTVYYRINPMASYSDGRKVQARDFLLNICLRSSFHASDPYYLNVYRTHYAAVRTYGDRVVAVTLPRKRPLSPYLAAKYMLPANPVFYAGFDASYTYKYQWEAAPTTGAYTVASQDVVKGRRITLRRVKDWWARDLKYYRNTCNVDSITYHFINEENMALERFRRGEIDTMTVYKPEIWNEKLEVQALFDGYIRKVTLMTEYPRPPFGLFMNTAMPPFDDLNVRKGVSHAMNFDLVLEQVFQGDMERAGSYAGGYGDFTDKAIKAREYSPELARLYFAEAGYIVKGGDGILRNSQGRKLSIDLTFADMSPMMTTVSALLKQHARICGLEVNLEPLESSVCSRKVFEKRHQIAFWAWPLPYPLPELAGKFHSSLAYDDSGRLVPNTDNIVSIADDELDRALLEESRAETREEFIKATHHVQRRLDDLAVWVPGWEAPCARVAFWRWIRWPDSAETKFCYPAVYNPLESHLFWVDENIKEETLKAKLAGESFVEYDETVNMPAAEN